MTVGAYCVVAGDASLYSPLEESLGPDGPEIRFVRSSDEVFKALEDAPNAALVVDDDFLDLRATDVLKRVRQTPDIHATPVIVLSKASDEIDRVVALELGADDFVSKPVNPRELALRIKALLRRSRPTSVDDRQYYKLGPLAIDVASHQVSVDGNPLELTALEFRLLVDLVRRAGQARSRNSLLAAVWQHPGTLETRTVDTHIKRLREKLNPYGRWIETVRGVGYRIRRSP